MCAGGVQHIVEKVLRRATSLLQTSSQSEVKAESYELPKFQKSNPRQCRDSQGGMYYFDKPPTSKGTQMWIKR
jgi:hypothetical protein